MIDYIKNKEFLDLKDKVFDIDFLNSKFPSDYKWSMDYKEGTILYNLTMKLKPYTIVEIGTFHGFSASYFLYALQELNRGIIFTVELEKENCDNANSRLFEIGERFSVINSPSTDVNWTQPIDLLFIDGEHSKVKDDLDKYVPFVSKGGLILCHDYHGIHCKNGIDKFFNPRKNEFEVQILLDNEFKNDLYIAYKKDN